MTKDRDLCHEFVEHNYEHEHEHSILLRIEKCTEYGRNLIRPIRINNLLENLLLERSQKSLLLLTQNLLLAIAYSSFSIIFSVFPLRLPIVAKNNIAGIRISYSIPKNGRKHNT